MSIPTVFVANKLLPLPVSPNVSSVRVSRGADVADGYIVTHAEADDVAITADIPLAAALVGLGLVVIDPRGDLYDADNVRERLSIRDFMHQLREEGVMTGGPAAFDTRTRRLFAQALDRELTRAIRRQGDGRSRSTT
ncbi:MAG: DUF188 domain-containing protein [Candidatus Riflebacteria bacterium]|nr:DUF188 domain-containing protein [Candidatus Riflebacteria bacterium]